MATVDSSPILLTAEQFATLPLVDSAELIRGVIVTMPPASYEHGRVCSKVVVRLATFVEEHQLGEVLSNDSGVVTNRGPDNVRGADVAFYSYARFPKEAKRTPLPPVAPDLVFEVLSEGDRWSDVMEKVNEYMHAGVPMVCVLEPALKSMQIFSPDKPTQVLRASDEFVGPGVLSGFRLPIARFFE